MMKRKRDLCASKRHETIFFSTRSQFQMGLLNISGDLFLDLKNIEWLKGHNNYMVVLMYSSALAVIARG